MEKYSNKYINSFDILKYAVIGFEFEFYSPGRPFYKLLELLNRELDVKVNGYRVYHSSGEVDEKTFKIESDLSLGPQGVELITGPLPYVNAKYYLLRILKILQGQGFSTDEKCSIHVNISFNKESNKPLEKTNKLKVILNMDEDLVYKYFPNRENNFYAKSIKRIIPFKSFDFSSNAASLLMNSLELPDTKYYGVNFLNLTEGRVEFRYIGDKDYQFKSAEILELMDYFILLTYNSIDVPLTEEDLDLLNDYLSDNINRFKNFTKLDSFTGEFPTITLQVDKDSSPILLRSYYEQFYDELYELITNIYNLNNCIINYDSERQKLEIVDANFKTIFDIKNIDVVDSIIDGGSFSNCVLVGCDIKNAHIDHCKVMDSNVFNTKVENCKIEYGSVLTDCYLFNTLLDAEMKGGVFRSGKLGENAILDDKVDIVTNVNSYFGKSSHAVDKSGLIDMKKIGNKSNKKNYLKGYNNNS